MIAKALDRYNRIRPENAPIMTTTSLAVNVLKALDREQTYSAVVSMKGSFSKIDKHEQKSLPLDVLKALTEVLETDYTTLLNGYFE